jgi:hypothetical protein
MTIPSVASRPERRRGLILAGFLLLLAAWVLAPRPVVGQARALQQGRKSLDAGRLSEAHRLAEQAIQVDPRNPQAHLLLGSVLLAEGKLVEASKSFEFAVALDRNLRFEVGRSYLAAIHRAVAASDPDRALSCLEQAKQVAPGLQRKGVEILFDDAFSRFRAGDAEGAKLLGRWLAKFPDYTPGREEDQFALARYLEANGERSAAARLYAECARRDPDGELGQRAKRILQSRSVRVGRQLDAPCGDRIFVVLRDLELDFDATKADLSLVWVSGDRSRKPQRSFSIQEDSKIETADGKSLSVLDGQGPGDVVGRDLELRSDEEHRVALRFPPVPGDAETISLDLVDDACGRGGRWGRHTLRFSDISLSAGEEPLKPSTEEVAVDHLHHHLGMFGKCSGTLRFTPEQISYLSGSHSFDLPCRDVVRIGLGSVERAKLSLSDFKNLGAVPTLLIEGRVATRRGKVKTETWNFVAQDGTPPVLLLDENLCPNDH